VGQCSPEAGTSSSMLYAIEAGMASRFVVLNSAASSGGSLCSTARHPSECVPLALPVRSTVGGNPADVFVGNLDQVLFKRGGFQRRKLSVCKPLSAETSLLGTATCSRLLQQTLAKPVAPGEGMWIYYAGFIHRGNAIGTHMQGNNTPDGPSIHGRMAQPLEAALVAYIVSMPACAIVYRGRWSTVAERTRHASCGRGRSDSRV